MAYDNTEVEIKVGVTEQCFRNIERELIKYATPTGTSEQIDNYFSQIGQEFLRPVFPYVWLSIRTRNGIQTLNYKHFFPEGAEIHTHCKEINVVISSADLMRDTLLDMGFEFLICVTKRRMTFLVNEGFEVALDQVEELGFFVEVEATRDFGGLEVTRMATLRFADSIGLDTRLKENRGYPYQLLKKKGLVSSQA